MAWIILYCLITSVTFSGYYIGHKKINCHKRFYDDGESIFFATITAVFWPATIWIVVPYIVINLYKN